MTSVVWKKQRKERKKTENKNGRENNRGASVQEILEVKKGIQKSGIREDTSAKTLGPCYRTQERICTKEGEGVLAVEGVKRRDISICRGSAKEELYPTI